MEAVRWSPDGSAVRIIDQTKLPERYEELDLRTLDEVCEAISALAVRGAPAIGIAGAMGLVVSLEPYGQLPSAEFMARLADHAERIKKTRPTAVNLPWAMDRMVNRISQPGGPPPSGKYDVRAQLQPSSDRKSSQILAELRDEASSILAEDRAMCRRIGEQGLPLIPVNSRILTHCNAGALATGGIGTALAPIYLAAEAGRNVEVFADETRPLFQGSRLTAWELARAGIPVTVLADSVAASLMRAGRVDLVIVGADRIAANGDVANKIGTYAVAVAARYHGIPFYVAAPRSTFDPTIASGNDIEIEERARSEIATSFGRTITPDGVRVANPAFDITPAALITAIISDQGVHRAPYDFSGARDWKNIGMEAVSGARGENPPGFRAEPSLSARRSS
ncbi:MAG: S-methyl-5-thioribose-1-phosphate isomerase [Anaerolineae bacterium]|nr:S-methyl-5-thioribose-1-phosphate isomerase [Gemmatimonadaceae bacterium]